jgi:hypothetical protein
MDPIIPIQPLIPDIPQVVAAPPTGAVGRDGRRQPGAGEDEDERRSRPDRRSPDAPEPDDDGFVDADGHVDITA